MNESLEGVRQSFSDGLLLTSFPSASLNFIEPQLLSFKKKHLLNSDWSTGSDKNDTLLETPFYTIKTGILILIY